jgi:hypothetical protein
MMSHWLIAAYCAETEGKKKQKQYRIVFWYIYSIYDMTLLILLITDNYSISIVKHLMLVIRKRSNRCFANVDIKYMHTKSTNNKYLGASGTISDYLLSLW